MKIFAIICFLLFSMLLSAQTKELAYEQHTFDSDTCCWRKLSVEGRHNEAAALLVNYLKNSPNVINKHSLKWHAGQLFAKAGNTRQAVKYYRKTYTDFYKWFGDDDALAWYYYAKGNIAHVKNDKKSLEQIIAKWDKKKLEKDINYKVLIGLLENWNKQGTN